MTATQAAILLLLERGPRRVSAMADLTGLTVGTIRAHLLTLQVLQAARRVRYSTWALAGYDPRYDQPRVARPRLVAALGPPVVIRPPGLERVVDGCVFQVVFDGGEGLTSF